MLLYFQFHSDLPLLRVKTCTFSVHLQTTGTMATDANVNLSQFIIPDDVPVVSLECKKAFEALTSKEKKYTHFLARASWSGGLICLFQTSPESPLIYVLLQKLFKAEPLDSLKERVLKAGVSEAEFQAFLTYAAAFFSNLGNYKSFGDTKFIPNLPKAKFSLLVKASAAYAADPAAFKELLSNCEDAIFSLSRKEQQMGLGDDGITTYFSCNCTMADAELAKRFMTEKKIDAYNTRLFKTKNADGGAVYEVRLASAQTGSADGDGPKLGTYDFEDVKINVTRGDYAPLMKMVSENLLKAKEYGANEHQENMLQLYARCFTTGHLQHHMDGSRSWIKDKGPIVEHYIGFIESYRDPFGMRGEWEGFVSIVNKEMSAKFGSLVDNAETFLPLLPWPKAYEKDRFLKPDFTSLEVLNFASSGIPAGINIPNYDDIRQTEGFKNVSLGNVLSAHTKDQKVTFLNKDDKELYSNLKAPSFEVQVGLHELLGHGSGKHFIRDDEQKFNFDIENVKHTETGDKIVSWYLSNDTYDSKFPIIASSYEECRAECVGLYLCLSRDILKIFGHEGSAADDIMYVNWLNMVRAGLMALEFYTPDTRSWRQAHMQARYVILRVLLEAGQGLITIERSTGEDGKPDATVLLDRAKIDTVGKEAIGNFLRKLQVYKSTGDYKNAKAMYSKYSTVDDSTAEQFLSLRQVVLARKLPRRMFVQVNTTTDTDGEVVLREYEPTTAGIIQSFVERFEGADFEQIVTDLWKKDQSHFY